MEMKDYEFYVTLKDGKGFKVIQKARTMSEAKQAVEGQKLVGISLEGSVG